MTPDPYIKETSLVCQKCRHEWTQGLINCAPLAVILAQLRSVRCPNCRAHWKLVSFRLRETPKEG